LKTERRGVKKRVRREEIPGREDKFPFT